MKLISFIKKLEEINSLSKHEQLVLGVVEAIDSGSLNLGDQLPSINTMVGGYRFCPQNHSKSL